LTDLTNPKIIFRTLVIFDNKLLIVFLALIMNQGLYIEIG